MVGEAYKAFAQPIENHLPIVRRRQPTPGLTLRTPRPNIQRSC